MADISTMQLKHRPHVKLARAKAKHRPPEDSFTCILSLEVGQSKPQSCGAVAHSAPCYKHCLSMLAWLATSRAQLMLGCILLQSSAPIFSCNA